MSKQIKKSKKSLFHQTRITTVYNIPKFKRSKRRKFKKNVHPKYFLEERRNTAFFQTNISKLTSEKWARHQWSNKTLSFIPLFFYKRRYNLKRFFKNSIKAKQLLKTVRMVMTENQLQNLLQSTKHHNLRLIKILQKIEYRLDIIMFRMGISNSAYWIRQAITYGLVEVNGKIVTKPGQTVKVSDVIKISEKYKPLIYSYMQNKGVVLDHSLIHLLINFNNLSCTIVQDIDEQSLPFPDRKLDLYFLNLLERS